MKNHTIYKSLQEYFKNTPKEKIIEDWNEFQHLDDKGITVKQFLENQKQTDEKGRPLTYWGGLEENKQETVEEAAERLYPTTINSFTDSGFDMSETERLIFINGAKWQQEQDKNLYSEEEVHDIIESYQNNVENNPVHITYTEWFEQYKKK